MVKLYKCNKQLSYLSEGSKAKPGAQLYLLARPFLQLKKAVQSVSSWNVPYSLRHHGLLNIWTELLSIFLADLPTWGGNLGPKLHPRGGFFGPWFFIILKNSHQDLSNEGSNFILSSLEVDHWVAQTFFDKLPEITDFGLLLQYQNRTRF